MSFLFKKKDAGSLPVKEDVFAEHSAASSASSSASHSQSQSQSQQRNAVLAASSAPSSPAMASPSDMVYSPQQPLRQPPNLLTDQSTASTASHSSGSTPMSTSPISSPKSLQSSAHNNNNNQQQQQNAYYQHVPTLHAATSPNSGQQQQPQQPMFGQPQHVQPIPGFSPHQAHTNLVPAATQSVQAIPTALHHPLQQQQQQPIASTASAVPIASSSAVSVAFPSPPSSSASSQPSSQPGSPTHSNRDSPSASIDQMQSMSVFEEKQSEDTLILRAHFTSLTHQSRSLFHVGDTLGTGTFGRVRLVSYLQSSLSPKPLHFALKMLKKSEIIRLKQVEHIKAEKSILSRICHPFIVNLFTHFQDERYLYMLMEYVIGGELFSQLRKVGRFSNDTARFYAAEIVLALQYLHSKDIVYRDLKPENLLIDREGHIKITDFGFAKVVEDRTWTLCGTPEYLAPEIIQSKGHGKAVDWWALGILIYEMISGYPPFYDENPFGIYQKILAGRIDFPRHFDPYAKDLVKKLLTADRSKRFGCLRDGADDVKRHRWFKGVDWGRVYNRRVKPPYVPGFASSDDTCFPQADHDVLTDEGFMSYSQFSQAKERGRAVHVACPVLPRGADASDGHYAIEWRPISKVHLITAASHSFIHFRSQSTSCEAQIEASETSSDMDLLVTSNHRMLVSTGSANDTTKHHWPSPIALQTAQQVYDEASHTCRSTAQTVSFLCYASHGAVPVSPTQWSSLPCSTALNLAGESEVEAFLELYGFFLGAGRLVDSSRAILFCTRTTDDVPYFDSLFDCVGLEQLPVGRRGERHGFKKVECGQACGGVEQRKQYRVYHPAWWSFFTSQDGSEDEPCRLDMHESDDTNEVHLTQLLGTKTASSCVQSMPRWVLHQLDARGCRLVLRGLRFAAGDQATELEAKKRLTEALDSSDVSTSREARSTLARERDECLPCTGGSIFTKSTHQRDDVERLALHAGFTATTSYCASPAPTSITSQSAAWCVHFLHKHHPNAQQTLTMPTIHPPQPQHQTPPPHQPVRHLLSPSPIPVWCLHVPTAEQLLVVRRRLTGSRRSRPTIVGNSNFDKYPDSDGEDGGVQLAAKDKEQFVDF